MKTTCIIIVVVLAAIQFIRPVKNEAPGEPGAGDITTLYPTPPAVKNTLQRACYDCHSNHTNYPWYAEIQPLAWWLADHVKEGKSHLNFSTFGAYAPRKQSSKLGELIDEVEKGQMPLTSYKLVHAEARLAPAEVKALVDWAEALRASLPASPAK